MGGGQSKSASSLKKCDTTSSENLEEVNFGQEKDRNVCWTLEPASSTNLEITEDQKYTELFKVMWDEKDKSWNSVYIEKKEFWTSWCTDGSKGWALPEKSESTKKQYSGICEQNIEEEKTFVEVDNSNNDKLEIKLCQGSCWQEPENQDSTHIKSYTTTTGSWNKVIFKREKITETN